MAPSETPPSADSVLLEHQAAADALNAAERCSESLPVPGVLRALMDFLREDFGSARLEAHGRIWRRDLAYTYFAGVSGEAFRFAWSASAAPDALDPLSAPQNPVEPYDLAFAASGFDHEVVLQAEFSAKIGNTAYASAGHERLRSRVIRSISAGRPVVAAGITGAADTCLLTGFGDRGDIVMGWKMSPGESPGILFEPDKRFRFDDWYDSVYWMVFLRERKGRPPLREVFLSACATAARLLTTPAQSGGWLVGPAALESWARSLRDDAGADSRLPEALYPWIWDLAERRWYGARFLESALPEFPDRQAEIVAAVRAFDEEHDLMWRIHALAQPAADGAPTSADRFVRREIAEIVESCRSKDAEAAEQLQRIAAS